MASKLCALILALLPFWPLLAEGLGPDSVCPADAAERAYRAGDFAAAAELYQRSTRCGTIEANLHYNAACAQALAGRPDAAFASLAAAIELGFTDVELLARDGDLDALRSDPRWGELSAAIEAERRASERIWGGAAFATAFREDLPADEKVAGLARLWAEARSNFAYFDQVPELDWDAAFLEWLPRVRATRSTADYYRELQALVARLGDGHTNTYPPKQLWAALYSRPPVETRRIEERVLVTEVLDSELRARGVVPGLEVVAIDGEPVESYAARAVRPYQSASTPQDLAVRDYDQGLLRGAEGSSVELRLADGVGGERTVRLERWSRERLREVRPAPPVFELEPLGEGVLGIALRSFETEEVVEQWFAHWQEIAAARALVLDLRDNGGGDSGKGYRILATLVDRPFLTSAWRTRLYRPSFRAWGQAEGWYRSEAGERAPDTERRFAGPVAVLIGPRTYSAAEDFAVAFDAAERGLLVGEPTGGSTGQPVSFTLPGGGSARICTKRDTYPDGRDFVGVGVQPDLAVAPTVADVRAGGDPVLAAALEALREPPAQ